MPTEVLRLLCDLVGTKKFDYFVNPTSTGTLRMLVYVEDLNVLDAEWFDLIPRAGDFVVKECQAWRLSCCEDALEDDCEYWRSFLEESGGRPNFNKFRFKETEGTLVDVLTKKVNERLCCFVKPLK
ncbi:hypothetical protein E5D57_000197 [Metarhizium anisopliae]|nr:hypothetical protein E5D57_000197 [Metarhizium anisopliae]